MGGACGTYGRQEKCYRISVGRSEGKRPLGRPRRRCRILLKCIFTKWDGSIDWIDLAQDRDRRRAVVKAVMNLQFP
jgi:hypothetical protein